ncbi:hypothetical protein JCM3770_006577 [Rhodotorula araucariae]
MLPRACLLFALGASLAAATISITTQQQVALGEPIKFQWSGGKPPYTLKIFLDDSVVSQNEGWTGNSVQWRASEDQVPTGTVVKVRVIDSQGDSVLSDGTLVTDGKPTAGGGGGGGGSPHGEDRDGQGASSTGRYQPMTDPLVPGGAHVGIPAMSTSVLGDGYGDDGYASTEVMPTGFVYDYGNSDGA